MVKLTQEDRENIQNQMQEYRDNPTELIPTPSPDMPKVVIPLAPDGQDANTALDEIIQEQSTPDAKETKGIINRVKGLWRRWRLTALDAKSLEVEKIACQIAIERAITASKLAQIKRDRELADTQHWLALNKGNLEEIGANTTSKPSLFWYGIRRLFHHITKLTANVPSIIKNLFSIGFVVIIYLLLKQYNII